MGEGSFPLGQEALFGHLHILGEIPREGGQSIHMPRRAVGVLPGVQQKAAHFGKVEARRAGKVYRHQWAVVGIHHDLPGRLQPRNAVATNDRDQYHHRGKAQHQLGTDRAAGRDQRHKRA